MLGLQCRLDGRSRAVLLEGDGNRRAGRILAEDSNAAADLTSLIRAARTSGRLLAELLAARAAAGEEVGVDLDSGTVTLAGEELAIGVPVDAPEVWAAGVSYERSREAREAESTEEAGADFYRRVHDAARPELFLKDAGGRRTVAHGGSVGVRADSGWTVPEPEIGLVLDADGAIVGYTIGNDMSARDIEGENPLYLPQAKIFADCCALGPAVWLPPPGGFDRALEIELRVIRAGEPAFEGRTSTAAMRRSFEELVSYLLTCNRIGDGTVLLTGTGIVPPDHFTVEDGDRIEISTPEIGTLKNSARMLEAATTRRTP